MQIGGLQKLTLIDYPGKIAATVFLVGCNFRCPYCFTENNFVLTDQGRLKIKDIVNKKINCRVYDAEGNFSSIKKYYQRSVDKILRIKTFLNSETIECTPSHKFLVFDPKAKKNIRKEARFIDKKNDYLTISIPQKEIFNYRLDVATAIKNSYKSLATKLRFDNQTIIKKVIKLRKKGYSWRKIYKELGLSDHIRRIIEKKDYLNSKIIPIIKRKNGKIAIKGGKFYINSHIKISADFMRLIGYYLSEGSVSQDKERPNSYQTSFTFNVKEQKYINDVKRFFRGVFHAPLAQFLNKKNKTVTLFSYKSIIGLFLRYYFGENVYNKKLPSDFIFLNKKFQKELIKGLFWGDGVTSENYIKKYQLQRIQLTSTTLRDQISLILYRLGIKHSRFRNEIIIKDKKIFDILDQGYLVKKKIIGTASRFGFLDDNYVYLKVDYIKTIKKSTGAYNITVDNKSHSYNISLVNVSNCHNPELVNPELAEKQPEIKESDFFKFLKERIGFLDGVCITGGEPTIHNDLPKFIKKIKIMGFLVKLDTNGSNSEMLENLVKNDLVDFIAMDIKTSALKYDKVYPVKFRKAGAAAQLFNGVKTSINIIKNNGKDYEFRTTVAPGIVDENDIQEIAQWLKGSKKIVLQQFRPASPAGGPEKVLDKSFENTKPYPAQDLEKMVKILEPHIEKVELRA